MGAQSQKNLTASRALPLAGAALLVAMTLAWGVTRLPVTERPQREGGDIIDLLFGGARQAVGGMLYARADVYFHGGVEPLDDGTHAGCEEELSTAAREGEDEHDHKHEHEAVVKSAVATGLWRWNPWGTLQAKLKPEEHTHLEGERQKKEILPWIWAAIKVDPNSSQPYMVGAYWLVRQLKSPEQGMTLIEQGIRALPENPDLEFCRGELLMRVTPPDEQAARQAFEQAVAKWKPLDDDDPQLRLENNQTWIFAKLYIASIDRRVGKLDAARATLREILQRYPENSLAQEQLARLQAPQP